MTSTDRLLASVIAALFVPAERENDMKAALGVVMVCVAFATARQVMIATTAARSMAAHREDFCIRILIAFILSRFLLLWFPWVSFHRSSCGQPRLDASLFRRE